MRIRPPLLDADITQIGAKKKKNIVNSIKQEAQHSKIDQENIMALTQNWRKSANIHFTSKQVLLKSISFTYNITLKERF